MKRIAKLCLALVASVTFGINANAQTLTWPTPVAATSYVGGDSDRGGVATAVFNNEIWYVYTSTRGCDAHGDCQLYMGHNSGGNSLGFTEGPIYSTHWTGGYIIGNSNPALATVTVNGTPTLFLAFRDSYGLESIVSYTVAGGNWNTAGVITDASDSVWGVTLAANPSDSTTLYAGYMNGSNYYPTICKINTSSLANSCQNFTNLRTMNFQPGLAFFNGLLYMAYEDRGDSHCLYGYTINVSTNAATTWNPNGCDQQTSTAPGLAVHNGYLYVAYRSNDSSQKFTVLVSTNGTNLTDRMQPGWPMTGPAALLDLNTLSPPVNQLMAGVTRSGTFEISLGQ